jgi:hypothetical protein
MNGGVFCQYTFRMGMVDRLKGLVASIYIEPAVFLFFISYGIFFVASQQLYIEKACKVNLGHNDTVCDNLSDHNATQLEAQKLISVLQVSSDPLNKMLCSLFNASRATMGRCRVFPPSSWLSSPVPSQTSSLASLSSSSAWPAMSFSMSYLWSTHTGFMN